MDYGQQVSVNGPMRSHMSMIWYRNAKLVVTLI
uniref:Uncharacterized protein n=1 Tax=Arundo donax TaxID=35708 RepID=A0A0A9HUE1_ARUDO